MSTYGEIQDRIANDYLNRTDFTSEVKRAILASVRFYERRRWRFNETATSVTTSAGQTFITLPTNFLVPYILKLTANGSVDELQRQDLNYILTMRDNASRGLPTDYTLYANRIELAVVPDSAYSCPVYYVKSLPELSASADSNGWTTGAMQDVIAYRASKLIWANTIRNDKEALKFAALEQEALVTVVEELQQFDIHSLKPTRF